MNKAKLKKRNTKFCQSVVTKIHEVPTVSKSTVDSTKVLFNLSFKFSEKQPSLILSKYAFKNVCCLCTVQSLDSFLVSVLNGNSTPVCI